MAYLIDICLIVFAYLIGSVSSAIIVCKCAGLPDPRTLGSKNPGATNVLRLGGKIPAFFTLVGDAIKAVVPVLLAKWLGASSFTQALLVLVACLGHMYPLFFGFKGGKGVATGLGGLLALSLPLGSFAIVVWLVVAALFRYASLSSVIAFLLTPVYVYLFSNKGYFLPLLLLSLLIIAKHHTNIKKLFRKEEKKIGRL